MKTCIYCGQLHQMFDMTCLNKFLNEKSKHIENVYKKVHGIEEPLSVDAVIREGGFEA